MNESLWEQVRASTDGKGTGAAKSPPDTVMTIAESPKYREISRSTLYKLAQEGKLPGQKVDRHWRFHRDAVDEWLRTGNKPTAAETGGAEK